MSRHKQHNLMRHRYNSHIHNDRSRGNNTYERINTFGNNAASSKTARHRNMHYRNDKNTDRSRSRSRGRKYTKSVKSNTNHSQRNVINNYSNNNQHLYGKLFSKPYQLSILNIINKLQIITFDQIYNLFKQTDIHLYGVHITYNEILNQLNGIEKNV
eukprot:549088_1